MKVVQLNCVFAQGSTGKIVAAIHDYMREQGDESFVLYGLGPKVQDSNAIRVVPPLIRKAQSLRSRITGYPYGGSIWGSLMTIDELKKIKPDVVHIHCFNAYIASIYKVLNYLKSARIPTVITNHAEFMYTGGCTHALDCEKWLSGCGDCPRLSKEHPISWFFDRTADEWARLWDAYDGFDNLTICCVSDWVRERASKSPFFTGHDVKTVLNGLDIETFKYRPASSLRKDFASERGGGVVVHVTPDFKSPIKGGVHVLEMAKRMPDASFVIVGVADGASSELPNVHFVGRAETQEKLAEYYSMADACLLTSEIETFSMVTAESLCCGTPVVGFEAGGPESIAFPEYSVFSPQGDDDRLEQNLKRTLAAKVNPETIARSARLQYGQKKMCEQYRSIYMNCITRQHNLRMGVC